MTYDRREVKTKRNMWNSGNGKKEGNEANGRVPLISPMNPPCDNANDNEWWWMKGH